MDRETRRVLLVEDTPQHVVLFGTMLARAQGAHFELAHVDRLSLALERVAQGDIDVVLLDLALPDSEGMATLTRMHAHAPSIPIVVLTATEDEALGLRLVQAGAQDYLAKAQVNQQVLVRTLRYAIERRRREDALARQAAALREQARLLDLAHDAIFVRAFADGRITFWNRGAEAMYGWANEEALGQVSHLLLQTEFPRPLAEIEAEFNHLERWEGELVHTRRDGTKVPVASRWALWRDEQGRPLAILEIDSDITQRKRSEEALRQAELRAARLQTVTEVGATVAHELNQPLSVITGYLDMLRRKPREGAEAERLYAEMSRAAQDLAAKIRIIRGLKDYITKSYGEDVTVLDLERSAGIAEPAEPA